MRLLLDTHTLIWFITDDAKLSPTALQLIEDGNNTASVSIASLWEIAIKMRLGKLLAGANFDSLFPSQLTSNAIDLMPIELAHVARVATLSLHHRDPFDRLLIAQALHENLPIISADAAFDDYGVRRLW